MSDKQCKIGVQLMPLCLVIIGGFYYAAGSNVGALILTFLGLLFWLVLWVEDYKNLER